MKGNKELFKCSYFTVEKLAAGVYAAFASEEGGALSNSGIIDLGDKTVVFDTFLSADAAMELRKFAEAATGRKAAYVINSHSHFDHVLGNCAFDADTSILATRKVYDELKAHEGEIDAMKKDAPQIVSSLREKLRGECDEISRKMLERDIKYFEMVGKEDFSLRLPDVAIEDGLELAGTSGRAVLAELDGHTGCDLMLYLPEEKIAFTGDLLFTGTHPWLGAGDPKRWAYTLKVLQRYDVQILIPGHGYAGEIGDVVLIEEYIGMIEDIARKLENGEYRQEDVGEKMLREPFRSWKGNKFLPNIKFYTQYLSKGTSEHKQ